MICTGERVTETPRLAWLYADARALRIYGGASEIMREFRETFGHGMIQ